MGMACVHLILPLIEGLSMGLSLEQGVVASRGVEAVEEYSGVGEGSVVGSCNAWGLRWNLGGSALLKG